VLNSPSEEGIRRVLRRLTKQGIVLSTKVGNAHRYQLNRSHLAAEYVVSLAGLQNELLERLADRISAWKVRPKYAAVFGYGLHAKVLREVLVEGLTLAGSATWLKKQMNRNT
jgi:hypothetical protein